MEKVKPSLYYCISDIYHPSQHCWQDQDSLRVQELVPERLRKKGANEFISYPKSSSLLKNAHKPKYHTVFKSYPLTYFISSGIVLLLISVIWVIAGFRLMFESVQFSFPLLTLCFAVCLFSLTRSKYEGNQILNLGFFFL